jgi:outer membrane protein TolC
MSVRSNEGHSRIEIMTAPLPKPIRTQLENTIKAARDVAEQAARAALAQLAVGEAKAPDYPSDDLKALRRRLRAHGRAPGNTKHTNVTLGRINFGGTSLESHLDG